MSHGKVLQYMILHGKVWGEMGFGVKFSGVGQRGGVGCDWELGRVGTVDE